MLLSAASLADVSVGVVALPLAIVGRGTHTVLDVVLADWTAVSFVHCTHDYSLLVCGYFATIPNFSSPRVKILAPTVEYETFCGPSAYLGPPRIGSAQHFLCRFTHLRHDEEFLDCSFPADAKECRDTMNSCDSRRSFRRPVYLHLEFLLLRSGAVLISISTSRFMPSALSTSGKFSRCKFSISAIARPFFDYSSIVPSGFI
jgi:hypothetical protein